MNATLKPDVLRWARNKAGLSADDLADRVGVNLGIVQEWEKSGSIPLSLVEKLADKTRTAFGFLFLDEPPKASLPIADFRHVDDAKHSTASEELLEIIYKAQLKQNWYRDYLIANDLKPLPFVGQYSIRFPAKETANDIRETLNIGPALTAKATKWEDAIRLITEAAVENGILVLRAGYVGGNTGNSLSVDEFRGGCLIRRLCSIDFY